MASSLIRNVPLSPAVTGALLYALTKAPDQYRQPLLKKLREYLSPQNLARAKTTLKWLFAFGLARNLHIWLSDIAQNNFRLRSERHKYDWPNEVAVVTGAASGFGALIAKGLAAKGINVMAVDVKDGLPEDMKNNSKIHYYKCDLTQRQKVMDLAAQIRKEHGDASILVNNAGVCFQHTVLDASEKALNSLYDVNILSHYWTLQAFLPSMIERKKGHVLATASMASFISAPGLVPYCNTKAAVLSLHDGLKQEVRVMYQAPEIKFSVVHPTYANTPMAQPFSQELKDKKVFVSPSLIPPPPRETHSHTTILTRISTPQVLDPNTVANAVVNQILSGKSRQIVLGGGTSWLAGLKAWPHWFAQALIRLSDGAMYHIEKGVERTGG